MKTFDWIPAGATGNLLVAMLVATLFAVAVVTVVVHEAGHAVAAALLRLPWRPALLKHGPAIVIGRDDLDLTRRQVALTAAGGPLANIALCVVAYMLGQGLVVMFGVMFAAANLLPIYPSDGWLMLRPGRAIARARAAQESR